MSDVIDVEAAVLGTMPESNNTPAQPRSSSSKLKFFDASDVHSTVRLRRTVRFNPTTSAVVGFDWRIHPEKHDAVPFVELVYDYKRDGQKFASMRMNSSRITIERAFDLKYKKLSARLDVAAGVSAGGEPIYGVSVHKVKPWPVVLGLAAILFATGKRVAANEKIGRFLLDVPMLNVYSESRWQCSVSADRTRRDGVLKLHAFNPVINLQAVL